MPETAAVAPRPGRPSSGADERILRAAVEVLKRDGYAGLTTAKVAARSGHNKALISYHFGSKLGLVTAAAHHVSQTFTSELLDGLGEPRTTADLTRAVLDGLWRILDRDEGLARVYFDLVSQSVVEPEIRAVIADMKQEHRRMLAELLGGLDDAPPPERREAAAFYLMAGLDGLALARLDSGRSAALTEAREMFARQPLG